MTVDNSQAAPRGPVTRADGTTSAERLLKSLCDRTFLTLWSYPSVFRDQGRNGKGDGKEVCDLLVVFENHVVIFSDKDCIFPDSGDIDVDWSRWYRRAIEASAKQIWGAERWIRDHPELLFMDRTCSIPFPITLPDPADAKYHRVLVAHGSSERCRAAIGGSGSLMIDLGLVGTQHSAPRDRGGRPFAIGRVDADRGYVHVFDDTTLPLVLDMLDTATEFVDYLTRKEELIASGRLEFATGEEDLLSYYFEGLNEHNEHVFLVPDGASLRLDDPTRWSRFASSPRRLAQIAANQTSYAWDMLIEAFVKNVFGDSLYHTTVVDGDIGEHERLFRHMAREPRTRRRLLAEKLLELVYPPLEQGRPWGAGVVQSTGPKEPHYVFLVVRHPEGVSYEEYREARRHLLQEYCMVVKYLFPDATDIVGIASEPGRGLTRGGSEDALHLDAREWTPELQEHARYLHEEVGLFRKRQEHRDRAYEFPDVVPLAMAASPRARRSPLARRNDPCPCGSGRKFKKCCL